jgi:peptidyl-tRNA hydrolase, PTH1 family
MKLIVGLGNPGEKYLLTRHNVGFRAIFSLAKTYNISSTFYRHKSLLAEGDIFGHKLILAQPLIFMNKSGEAVKLLKDFYQLSENDIIIIYDDLDIPPGKIRIKIKGSSGGHNGIKSIIESLNTRDFPRIRIGIGRPPEGIEAINYVLGYFTTEEDKLIEESVKRIQDVVELILKDGFQEAMNKYN